MNPMHHHSISTARPPRHLPVSLLDSVVNRVMSAAELHNLAAERVVQLLVQASVQHRSLEHVVRQASGAASPTAVRKVLSALLLRFRLAVWEDKLNEALRARWLPLLAGRRDVDQVGDEVNLAYWGRREGELKTEVRGGSPKQGTAWFFTYVTLCALWRGRRIVLGVTRLRAHERVAEALARLGEPLLAAGLQPRCWLYDRGGASVAALGWWQDHDQPFVVAAPRRGDKTGVAAILNAAEAEEGFSRRRPADRGQWYTLHPEKSSGLAPRTVWLAIAWEPVKRGRRERRQRGLKRSRVQPGQRWRAVAYFTDGQDWRARASAVQAAYRHRQSIESSYRQSHASRARTSSRDPRLRLLLVGLSLILQNEWAWWWRVKQHQARRAGQPQAPRSGRRRDWMFLDYCEEVMQQGFEALRETVDGWWWRLRILQHQAAVVSGEQV